MKQRILPWRMVGLLLLWSASAVAASPAWRQDHHTPEQHFQFALEEQSHRNYKAMLRHLRVAAQAGVVEAQETLGTVLLAGSTVYGNEIKADACEALRWFLQAARSGSDLGVQQVHFLNRARNSPAMRSKCRGG